jgi:hypothetical protein
MALLRHVTVVAHDYPNVLLTLRVGRRSRSLGAAEPGPADVVPIAGRRSFFLWNLKNYYHFLWDAVPLLAQCPKELPLLVPPEPLLAFVRDTFELLGYTWEHVHPGGAYEELLLPDEARAPHDRWAMFDALGGASSPVPPSSMPDAFYISRRGPATPNAGTDYRARRLLENEAEVVAALGLPEVFCETLTMAEKIRLFRGARLIVGSIGGGLTNAVFCDRTRLERLVCIESPDFLRWNTDFHDVFARLRPGALLRYVNTEPTRFPLFVRAQVRATGQIGEIAEVHGDGRVTLTYSDTGIWSAYDEAGRQGTHALADVTLLDAGINGPWRVNGVGRLVCASRLDGHRELPGPDRVLPEGGSAPDAPADRP